MTENIPYLIAGLGNPGPKYRHNRHNVGFMVLDAFAEHTQIPIQRVQFRTLVGKGLFHEVRLVLAKPQTYMNVSGQAEYKQIPIQRVQFRTLVGKGLFHEARLVLAKPQTYMNVSGQAVVPLMKFYKIPPERLMVVHDDLDLPFGTLRLRPEGGAGGQHGVESIITKLGRRDFARMRIGIGRPPGRMDPRDYVLHNFDPPEVEFLPAVLQHAVDAIISFICIILIHLRLNFFPQCCSMPWMRSSALSRMALKKP